MRCDGLMKTFNSQIFLLIESWKLYLVSYIPRGGGTVKKVCVIGSINVDLVTSVDDFPKPGETIIGNEFRIYPGGKGANQAVAAGRLGADVEMIAKVGDDVFGNQMLDTLKANNVGVDNVMVQSGVSTGVACIQVAKSSQNSIVISYGANAEVAEVYLDMSREVIEKSDIVMLQLEVPLKTVAWAVKYASESGKFIILDPAPAQKLDDEILKNIDIITPNETEIQTLTDVKIRSEEDILTASRELLHRGVKAVINKAGEKGAYLITDSKFIRFPTYEVRAVDTTAAGDSFNAGLAVSLAAGKTLEESIVFANIVAAISTTKFGAQSAMPTLEECNEFLNNNKKGV